MDKAGKSSYYELVTENNAHYRKAIQESYRRSDIINKGIMFQRGLAEEQLGNVDNGVSVFTGINYKKLPHYINWNKSLNNNSEKPIPLKAV